MYKRERKYCRRWWLHQCLLEYLMRKVQMMIIIFSFYFSQDVSLFCVAFVLVCSFFVVWVLCQWLTKVHYLNYCCPFRVWVRNHQSFFLWLAWSSLFECLCNPNPVNCRYVTTIFSPPCVCCSVKEKTKSNTSSQNFTKKLTWSNFLTVWNICSKCCKTFMKSLKLLQMQERYSFNPVVLEITQVGTLHVFWCLGNTREAFIKKKKKKILKKILSANRIAFNKTRTL